jgi:hypothetical protein
MMAYINNGDANPRARARAHDGGAIARDASARDQSDTELIKIGISREESRARARRFSRKARSRADSARTRGVSAM